MAGENSGLQQVSGCGNAEWTGWSRRAGCGKTDSVQDGYSAAVWFTLLGLCFFVCVFFDMQERVKMTKPLNLGHEIP